MWFGNKEQFDFFINVDQGGLSMAFDLSVDDHYVNSKPMPWVTVESSNIEFFFEKVNLGIDSHSVGPNILNTGI